MAWLQQWRLATASWVSGGLWPHRRELRSPEASAVRKCRLDPVGQCARFEDASQQKLLSVQDALLELVLRLRPGHESSMSEDLAALPKTSSTRDRPLGTSSQVSHACQSRVFVEVCHCS